MIVDEATILAMFLGVDTGGTFTDFVLFDRNGLQFHKELSTPDDPSLAIEKGIHALGLNSADLHLVHGSTVATNAILERKGVKTLFVTNRGLEDLLLIGRQTRDELYNLTPETKPGWIESRDCLGIAGRFSATGEEIEAMQAKELKSLSQHIRQHEYEAVAVSLLFSFLDPSHEQQLQDALPDGLFCSLSHRVLAEYREFERGATTFLNAYVGPLVQRYLRRLAHTLAPKHLFVMHSAGGVMPAEEAGEQAVKLALSGPAGGLVAATRIGTQLDITNLLTFDMGGTSTDVSLIHGGVSHTTEAEVAGIPIALPMLDIHTIGAGGGSLAWIDEAGLPQVGPESAGAAPGPACYGAGGTIPAVTDANLLLGRIPPSALLAGHMPLDRNAAITAFRPFAETLNLSVEEAAASVVRMAEAHMAAALRVVSVEKGYDPASFSLLCFGGAGGLHACSLAEAMGMKRVIYPVASGAFSALGMLAGRQQSDYSISRRVAADAKHADEEIADLFSVLEERALAAASEFALTFERKIDMRYLGQGFQLTVDYDASIERMVAAFEAEHLRAYGHLLQRPVEFMTARLTACVERPEISFPLLQQADKPLQPSGSSTIFEVGEVDHFQRDQLRRGHSIHGPALIVEKTATLWLPEAWSLSVAAEGHLILEFQQ